MSSDGVWHSQANYIFTVAGHKKTDRGGYGKIDASVFYYTCQPMPGGNCIPKVLRTGHQAALGVWLVERRTDGMLTPRSALVVIKEAVGNVLLRFVST